MVGPASRRRAVEVCRGRRFGQPCPGVSQSGTCPQHILSCAQAEHHESEDAPGNHRLESEAPRYGYRRITALLRRAGHQVNAKRVQRIRRREGIQVSRRQRRCKRVGLSTAQRQRAARTNDVWSWDFVHDQTENGSRFRILTLIDEHRRVCLATHAGWSIRAEDVITIVETAFIRYGKPQHLRRDNGPEFIAYAIPDWLEAAQIKTLYIKPGSPWENGHIESFHDKRRGECLNRELFGSLLEAQIILEAWRTEYNDERPHRSLRYQTPSEWCGGIVTAEPDREHKPKDGHTQDPEMRSLHELGQAWKRHVAELVVVDVTEQATDCNDDKRGESDRNGVCPDGKSHKFAFSGRQQGLTPIILQHVEQHFL